MTEKAAESQIKFILLCLNLNQLSLCFQSISNITGWKSQDSLLPFLRNYEKIIDLYPTAGNVERSIPNLFISVLMSIKNNKLFYNALPRINYT